LEFDDGPIWVSKHETTDVDGRCISNGIVGLSHKDNYSKPYLIMCEVLEKCNFQTIGKIFNDAMNLLWPSGVKYDEVLFFVSDAPSYYGEISGKNYFKCERSTWEAKLV